MAIPSCHRESLCDVAISTLRLLRALAMNNNYYVYILTNKMNTVLYTGITNNLERRIFEHKSKCFKGFTAKYNVNKLVYFEIYSDIYEAIQREK